MDIKARIDGLSEVEAKAALKWYANQFPIWLDCKYCYCHYCCVIDCNGGYDKCAEKILKHSLKEARDKNFYYPGLPNGDVTTVGNTGDYALKGA